MGGGVREGPGGNAAEKPGADPEMLDSPPPLPSATAGHPVLCSHAPGPSLPGRA